MNDKIIKSTGCCEPFNPAPWQDQEITWQDKMFVTDHVTSLLYIPLNFGAKMTKNANLIDKAGAKKPTIVISGEESLWGSNIYIDVDQDIPGAKMATISGTFLTKVFEGPYHNMGKWIKEMDAYVKAKGKTSKKLYSYYTTCPKCAKAYGKNYVVLLAQIA
jgi:hypothetical protein